jgi:hypothetical protein
MRSLRLPTENGELLAERKVLGREAGSRQEGRPESAKPGDEEGEHDRTFANLAEIVSGESVSAVG